jgi:hypothetical protein
VELDAASVSYCSPGCLIMHINKVHHVTTIKCLQPMLRAFPLRSHANQGGSVEWCRPSAKKAKSSSGGNIFLAPRAKIFSASSGSGRCSAFASSLGACIQTFGSSSATVGRQAMPSTATT